MNLGALSRRMLRGPCAHRWGGGGGLDEPRTRTLPRGRTARTRGAGGPASVSRRLRRRAGGTRRHLFSAPPPCGSPACSLRGRPRGLPGASACGAFASGLLARRMAVAAARPSAGRRRPCIAAPLHSAAGGPCGRRQGRQGQRQWRRRSQGGRRHNLRGLHPARRHLGARRGAHIVQFDGRHVRTGQEDLDQGRGRRSVRAQRGRAGSGPDEPKAGCGRPRAVCPLSVARERPGRQGRMGSLHRLRLHCREW